MFDSLLNSLTPETSSAGSGWSGIFGKILDTGATVAGDVLASRRPAAPAAPVPGPSPVSGQSNTRLYIIIGAAVAVVVGLVFFLRGK